MKNIWLIGAGAMAQDYIKVLNDLDVNLTVIGISENSAKLCEEKTSQKVIVG
jgi:prephenate dehydrogenase